MASRKRCVPEVRVNVRIARKRMNRILTAMTNMTWTFDEYKSSGQEGIVDIPGGVLRYRLAGPPTADDVVVFESGWSASYPYAVWLEEALSPHVRVLSYDRIGVGDSRGRAPPTPAGMTQQLTALLSSLGIQKPVVAAGHSYGGLIAALHAAQGATTVRAIVQIDPTPEFDHELIDPSYRMLPRVARFMQLCALLNIDGPIFFHTAKELPREIFARMKRTPTWLARSLNGSIREIRLLQEIRQVVTTSAAARRCPRLVISCDPQHAVDSWMRKLVIDDAKVGKYWDAVHELHKRQASLSDNSRWMILPSNHISLITSRANAHQIAAHILGFIR
jgi:pimeloyl-ACP methyl ester carboxylesterase